MSGDLRPMNGKMYRKIQFTRADDQQDALKSIQMTNMLTMDKKGVSALAKSFIYKYIYGNGFFGYLHFVVRKCLNLNKSWQKFLNPKIGSLHTACVFDCWRLYAWINFTTGKCGALANRRNVVKKCKSVLIFQSTMNSQVSFYDKILH